MTKRRSPRRTSRRRKKVKAASQFWTRVRRWGLLACGFVLVSFSLWVVYLDREVREKFDGRKWAVPARVYARPLELYRGLALTPELLEQELRALGYRPVERVSASGQYARRQAGAATEYHLFSRGFDFWDQNEPARRFTLTLSQNRITDLEARDGASLVRLEPEEIGGIFPAHGEDRLLIRLEDVPPLLGETLLAVEDRGFLDHRGLSPTGIARAAWTNLRAGRVVEGGSTLTQQLVKNFYLTQEQRFQRKLQEAIMSLLLERRYSKAEILETYINEIYLGQSGTRGVHGFALGAQHYFRQPLRELEPPQVALLVGLAKGASFYNPWRNPERARARRDLVLRVMANEGLISARELEQYVQAPLGIVTSSTYSRQTYPAVIDLVNRQLRRDYRQEDLQSEGLRIFTSLSPMVQRQAEQAVQKRIEQLEEAHGVTDLQGALVVTSVGAGEVLALVGDKNPRFAGFNRALDARRPVGSLIKPFVYLSALEQPQLYHPASLISDAPVTVTARDGQVWQPRNANLQSHGDVPLYQGLSQSYNQASARLGMELGLETVYDTLRQAGFQGTIPAVPSIILGAVDMAPLDVAGIYHTLAADGVYTPLRVIREVQTAEGQRLRRYPLELEQRFSPQSSYQLQYMLQLALREGTGRRVYDQFPADLMLAGKTGTTNDRRDSWFAGFSGQHLAVAWVGLDDNGVTPLTGSAGALQVWADFMRTLPTQSVGLEPPADISFDWLDSSTGLLSAEHCEGATWLPLRPDQQPRGSAPCRLASGSNSSWWQRLWR
ncbi:penicillin-binding protein 1B [Marinimicrobium sp. ABcell2]|uniref:penicillin-binding protein 1B n=1 Tax=Marinimicrobium sp. ABcell2 TaxID=3069751 RepID=UPI0027AE0B66|nr:penicillin-binding protein 1B [Marinimicrobium sp. ABcell2]MDQ2077646.1 penicillin-binding protein 1B [Marinimicrobium sp. ABcell2]